MKTFKPFDKVLYRAGKEFCWIPSLYQLNMGNRHFVIDVDASVPDTDILPYEGNEYLIGTNDEPEKEFVLKDGELILCSHFDFLLKKGRGTICNFSHVKDYHIYNTDGASFPYCIPMSKYNLENLKETSKWILEVKNGKTYKSK